MAEIALLGLGLGVGASVMEGIGNIQQLENQAKAQEYQAQISEQNAGVIRQQTKEEERRFRIEGQKILGGIRSRIAASGVNIEGTPMEVLEESAANLELDALTLRYNGELRARGLKAQANYGHILAQAARSQKFYAGASSVLKGGAYGLSLYKGLY